MPLNATIVDPKDLKKVQRVTSIGSSWTSLIPSPPADVPMTMRIYRQYLTDDGLAKDGTNQDMTVDGSSTAVDFYVKADTDNDIYIKSLSFVLTEPSMGLNEWANTNNSLTNGCRLFYEDINGEVDIADAIKTNWELIRLCFGQPAFGSGSTVFRASNVLGTDEGYLPFLDVETVFGSPWALRLKAGTNQKLTMRIRDDITSTDSFDCIVSGVEVLT